MASGLCRRQPPITIEQISKSLHAFLQEAGQELPDLEKTASKIHSFLTTVIEPNFRFLKGEELAQILGTVLNTILERQKLVDRCSFAKISPTALYQKVGNPEDVLVFPEYLRPAHTPSLDSLDAETRDMFDRWLVAEYYLGAHALDGKAGVLEELLANSPQHESHSKALYANAIIANCLEMLGQLQSRASLKNRCIIL